MGDISDTNDQNSASFALNDRETRSMEPIAICGMSMRLPGGINNTEALWSALVEKKELKGPVPSDRFNVDSFYSPHRKHGNMLTREAFYLDDGELGHFDSAFFNLNREELRHLDPQQRMILELTQECLENAGEVNWRGKRIGCYVGTFGEDWFDVDARETLDPSLYRVMGRADFAMSNRTSFEFDFRGPSMTIKTACSASMTCLNEACWAIENRQCDSAIIAGANMITTPTLTVSMGRSVLSPTGTCKSFDASADGYARGEAFNVLFVKRLSDALRDGNAIRAVIRSVGVNSGALEAPLKPSSTAQENLIRDTYKQADLPFSETAWFECHGTGTRVGDPIEANVVSKLFGDYGIHIGASKPNFGHSEGASALTAIFKTVLSLEKRLIPPNMRFSEPSPLIDFGPGRLIVPTEVTPWPQGRKDRVSINSFGVSGANGHVIIDAASSWVKRSASPRSEAKDPQKAPQLLVLSANLESSISRLQESYKVFIPQRPTELYDLAHTLGTRRTHHKYRSFCITSGDNAEIHFSSTTSISREPKQIVFVFTGQGALWSGAAVELLAQNHVFAQTMRRLDDVLQRLPECSFSLTEELARESDSSRIHDAEIAQPLSTALQLCLVNALADVGVSPAAVVGHSSGEIAAAYSAGAMTESEAMETAFFRGQAIKSDMCSGAMITVGLGRDSIEKLDLGVSVACENSPTNVTLSGPRSEIDAAIDMIEDFHPGCPVRRLQVRKAYHSTQMSAAGETYEAMLSGRLHCSPTKIPYFSALRGRQLDNSEVLGPMYWRQHLESLVSFRSAVEDILGELGSNIVLAEIGSHAALAGSLIQTCSSQEVQVPYVSFMRKATHSTETFLTGLGKLYQLGASIDFSHLTPAGRTLTDLPSYPWHHDIKHWNESRLSREWRWRKYAHHDLLGSKIVETSSIEPSWRNILRPELVSWIKGHKVHSDIVFPLAGYCAMAGEAIQQVHNQRGAFVVRHVVARSALLVRPEDAVEVITTLRPARLTESLDSEWFEFSVVSCRGTQWTKHCSGSVKLERQEPQTANSDLVTQLDTASFPREVDKEAWYAAIARIGFNYSAEFQGLRSIRAAVGEYKAVALVADCAEEIESDYQLHPTTIDCALQMIGVAMAKGLPRDVTTLMVPVRLEEMYIGTAGNDIELFANAETDRGGRISGEIIGDSGAQRVLHIKGLQAATLEGLVQERGPDPHAAAEAIWEVDIELMNSSQLKKPKAMDEKELRAVKRLVEVCAAETLRRIQAAHSQDSYPPQYIGWLQANSISAPTNTEPAQDGVLGEITALEQKLLSSPDAQCICNAVLKTFKGSHDTYSGLDISNIRTSTCISPSAIQTIRLLAHNNPLLRVLDLTVAQKELTASVLRALTTTSGCRSYSTYTIARSEEDPLLIDEEFSGMQGLDHAVIDITQDPVHQGFSLQSYDLVIFGADVCPARSDSNLVNIRKLLRPGGVFIGAVAKQRTSWSTYVFGREEASWAQDPDKALPASSSATKPLMAELQAAGFDDLTPLDNESPAYLYATVFARISALAAAPRNIVLLCAAREDAVVDALRSSLHHNNIDVEEILTFEEASPSILENKTVISVIDLQGRAVMEETSLETLRLLQDLVQSSAKCILWLTRPSQLLCTDPNYAKFLGLARTARTELGSAICTLELNVEDSGAYEAVYKVLCKLSLQLETRTTDALSPEFEYAFYEGSLHISRFQPSNLGESLLRPYEAIDTNSNMRTTLQVGSYGRLDSLHWARASTPHLRSHFVGVRVKAAGVNFKDVLIGMGIIDNNREGMGVEGSGVITEVGESVTRFKLGDRVMFSGSGCFAGYWRGTEKGVCLIPEGISFEEAATIPTVYMTVLYGLQELARLQKGESVLIHSGCGGVGLAAIQLCQMIGASIFVTVSNEAKVKHLMENYDIPRHRILDSRSPSFLPEVLNQTAGRGVDVVLNSLSGELLHASWKCVAPFGRMIELGKRDQLEFGSLDLNPFAGNRTYSGMLLNDILDAREDMTERLYAQLYDLLTKKILKPITPMIAFPCEAVEDAMRYLQKGQHIGKVVVRIPDDIDELPTSKQAKDLCLNPEGSYLLVGGLGGLGVAIARWMAEHGAKHIIFLSRTAGQSDGHRAIQQELDAMGCTTKLIAGSVAEEENVKKVVAAASPPIRGVVQASMVLRDRLIANMNFDDWVAVTDPKVSGTWNLHNALRETELDFFIVLSSLSHVVGQYGQSNYNAANAFLDAFVQYRHSQGLAASVLDVSPIGDSKTLQERPALLQHYQTLGIHLLYEPDVLDAMQWAIENSKPPILERIDVDSNLSTRKAHGRLTLGLRSTVPLQGRANHLPWSRDRRMALYHNINATSLDKNSAAATDQNASSKLLAILAKIQANPQEVLADPATVRIISEEIGRKILNMLLKPDEDEDIDIKTSLFDLGVDSLMGIEMKGWWRDVFGTEVNVLQIATAETIESLGELTVQSLRLKLVGQ